MRDPLIVLPVSLAYLGLLFAIAYWADKRADAGRSVVISPWVYTLSIAVYCTSWTFYGSVGRAAVGGMDFLTIYLGPTLMIVAGWFVIVKIIRISKRHHITSIADLIASRFGKSHLLAGLVTVIAIIGITPYIALQLKAIADSYTVLTAAPAAIADPVAGGFVDEALAVALILAIFSILFGTRHIDTTEHHQGMVAAVAFESVIKLIAFLTAGIFITYGLYSGFGDLFAQGAADESVRALYATPAVSSGGLWVSLTVLSMLAIFCLPRQFQVIVVENMEIDHFRKAIWLFPLYLLLINLFVFPIAVAGLLQNGGSAAQADMFVLSLPLDAGQELLALFVFIGGLSAATGMVIVASIALATMICNDLVMPVLLRHGRLATGENRDITKLLLLIRRIGICLVLLLGYLYYQMIGEAIALVSIGLVSFAAVAQFAPAILFGIYWKRATRAGALGGLIGGFTVWGYTLLYPSLVAVEEDMQLHPFGLAALDPHALFNVTGMDPISHALFWTMLANVGLLVGISIFTRQGPLERSQATQFVEVGHESTEPARVGAFAGTTRASELEELAARFVGRGRAHQAFERHLRERGMARQNLRTAYADSEMLRFTERLLAGAVGTASARVVVASTVRGNAVTLDDMMAVVDEAHEVIGYSRQLEEKSRALEQATEELREANARLQELDRMKDEFLSTVTHELRTPLTSIRSFSEILHDNPELSTEERSQFLQIIIKESERLTRLINQVLDLARLDAGRLEFEIEPFRLADAIDHASSTLTQVLRERGVTLELDVPSSLPQAYGDRDRVIQVLMNLLSNAEKFVPSGEGWIGVRVRPHEQMLQISISDNGPGIGKEHQQAIFDRFSQADQPDSGNPTGSGLGLAISQRLVEHMGGSIWVESTLGEGTTFHFTLPIAESEALMGQAAK